MKLHIVVRASARLFPATFDRMCTGEPPSPQGEGRGNTSFPIRRFLMRAVFKINTPCSFPAHIAFPLRGRCRRSRRMRCLFKSDTAYTTTDRKLNDNFHCHRSGYRNNDTLHSQIELKLYFILPSGFGVDEHAQGIAVGVRALKGVAQPLSAAVGLGTAHGA